MERYSEKMELTFKRIKNGSIFEQDFENLTATGNATIELKQQPRSIGGIAVVYAPNGTGKSSLARVLETEEETEEITFEAIVDAQNMITPANKVFKIIADQMNRNVIPGETSDYLIGQDIQREYRLRKKVNQAFEQAFKQDIPQALKNEYKVSKVNDYFLSVLQERNTEAYAYLRDIVNQRSRGAEIDRAAFMAFIRNPDNQANLLVLEEGKKKFVVDNSKVIQQLLLIDLNQIAMNTEVILLEQNDDAIGILKKYKHLQTCVVCDNHDFDGENILNRKTEGRRRIYENLDSKTKTLLDKVAMDKSLIGNDPFDIKHTVMNFIATGISDDISVLQDEVQIYVENIVDEMMTVMLNVFIDTTMYSDFDEYSLLLEGQPYIDDEELLYIEQIINDNIDRNIRLIRDQENDNNFKLMLDDKPLLGTPTKEMHLSAGEQNFISLAFELLLAKNSTKEFIVLDDPISSFDSVYKNKIAFCIVKFLEKKKQIILTHSTDLIRLLEVQLNNCFNLYILNNAYGGTNGFIRVKDEEQKILINLHDLIKLFQNKDGILDSLILDRRLFLISMVPFMRGYAHICKDDDENYVKLSQVMHGYETATVDVAVIYKILFGYTVCESENISVPDVLALDCSNINIIDKERYPLLAETLLQTLTYYHLRMKVEKELVEIFNLQINMQHPPTLTQVIQRAFNCRNTDVDFVQKRAYRVFFASRKTLLNEFNHFEGNMNIFQPAIDIEHTALQKEIQDITNKLAEIRSIYGN